MESGNVEQGRMSLEALVAAQLLDEENQSRAPAVHFNRPHVQLETFAKDLTQSLKRVFTTSPRRYDSVYVLLVRWKDDDLGTETEIRDLENVFRTLYNYNTERALIPSDNAYNSLESIVVDFRQRHDGPNNLLIFYYGGHGVKVPNHKSVWASKRVSGVQLNWSDMQPALLRSQADVLFLLDCCYAATVGTRERLQGAKEVIAACSMEDVTTGVDDNSFTRNLIKELKRGAQRNLTTWQLYGRMVVRRGKGLLLYTPYHLPLLDGDAPSIELRPFREYHERLEIHGKLMPFPATPTLTDSGSTISTEDETAFMRDRILLSINLKDWTLPPKISEWQHWLRTEAPGNISAISAVFQPERSSDTEFTIPPQDPGTWTKTLPTLSESGRRERVEEAIIRSEDAFDSHSTLLLVSVPLAIWTYLPYNPAYSFVGFVTSRNLGMDGALRRTSSMSELKKFAVEINDRHWWYKWYLAFAFVMIPIYWPTLAQRGVESFLSFLVFMGFVTVTPFAIVSQLSTDHYGWMYNLRNGNSI